MLRKLMTVFILIILIATAAGCITSTSNKKPKAEPSATPVVAKTLQDITFIAAGSDDGTIKKCEYDFEGDGTIDWTGDVDSVIVHQYSDEGTYNALLRVTDNKGAKSEGTITITIENQAPAVTVSAKPMTVNSTQPVSFSVIANDVDGSIKSYEWDFNGDGVVDFTNSQSGNTSKTYGKAGVYTAKLNVVDDDNVSVTSSVMVTVLNMLPTVSADANLDNTTTNQNIEFMGLASDVDGSIVKYEWDFDGDGTYDWSSDSTPETTHAYTNDGVYNAVLRVTDNDNGKATSTKVITIRNVAPSVSGTAGTHLAPTFTDITFTATGTDSDGLVSSYDWDFNNDGTYERTGITTTTTTYQYANNGVYSVTIRAWDDDGAFGIGSVSGTITIENQAPIVTISSGTLTGDRLTNLSVAGYANDIDGSIVKYQWDFDNNGIFEWSNTTAGTTTANTTHRFTNLGTQTISLRAWDDDNAASTTSTTVQIINIPPTVSLSASQPSVKAGGTLTFTATATDTDGAGISQYQWDFNEDYNYENTTTLNVITRQFTTVDANVRVMVKVTDADGGIAYANVTISVTTNNPPTLSSGAVSPTSGDTNVQYKFTVVYTDIDNDVPSYVRVVIDGGAPLNMMKDSTAPAALFDNDYTNGEQYYVFKSGMTVGSHNYKFEASDGAATTSTGTVNGPTVTAPLVNKYAIIIGIEAYPSSPLSGCRDDAYDWQAFLQGRGYTCYMFIDSAATETAVLTKIFQLKSTENAADYIAFVFSGHGVYSGSDSYICLYDTETSSTTLGSSSYFGGYDSQHMFFFFDCCESGEFAGITGTTVGTSPLAGAGRFVATACRTTETTPDGTGGDYHPNSGTDNNTNGLFAFHYLSYLGLTHGTQNPGAGTVSAESAATSTYNHITTYHSSAAVHPCTYDGNTAVNFMF